MMDKLRKPRNFKNDRYGILKNIYSSKIDKDSWLQMYKQQNKRIKNY